MKSNKVLKCYSQVLPQRDIHIEHSFETNVLVVIFDHINMLRCTRTIYSIGSGAVVSSRMVSVVGVTVGITKRLC